MTSPTLPIRAALAALAVLAAVFSPAAAQGTCGHREAMLGVLHDERGQSVRGIGLGADQHVLEWHANEETGAWTVTLTTPDGVTCVMAVGEAFAGFDAPIPGEDA